MHAVRHPNRTVSGRSRLPATVDTSLASFCQSTRQSFAEALANDQRAALEPVYGTSFKSANDVVRRLLPYHVWHVRDADILHILRDVDANDVTPAMGAAEAAKSKAPHTSTMDVDAHSGQDHDQDRPKKRRQSERTSLLRRAPIDSVSRSYPSLAETDDVWERYMAIHARAKRLRGRLLGACADHAPAPFVQESRYHLENAAWEYERELFLREQDALRTIKEQAIAAGVKWETIMRVTTGRPEQVAAAVAPHRSPSNSDDSDKDEDVSDNDEGGSSLAGDSNKDDEIAKAVRAGTPIVSSLHPGTTTQPPPGPSTRVAIPVPINERAVASPVANPIPSSSARPPRPRGRPRKERDANGNIIRTSTPSNNPAVSPSMSINSAIPSANPTAANSMPVLTLSNPPKPAQSATVPSPGPQPMHGTGRPSSLSSHPVAQRQTDTTSATTAAASGPATYGAGSAHRPPAPASMPPVQTANLSSAEANSARVPAPAAVPSVPIQLTLPFSVLTRLSSIGIIPAPAAHLVPAIVARQATLAQAESSGLAAPPGSYARADTAPQPAPSDQQEAALLLGITSGSLPESGPTDTGVTPDIMHISVKLNKLDPSQLSGLAELMQDVQRGTGLGGQAT